MFNFQITTHLIKFADYVINFNSFLMCLSPDAEEILLSRAERHAAGRVSPLLALGDFHARSRFARFTISEEKWGLLIVYSISRLVSSPRSPGRRCGLFPTRLCETHSVSLSKATSKWWVLKKIQAINIAFHRVGIARFIIVIPIRQPTDDHSSLSLQYFRLQLLRQSNRATNKIVLVIVCCTHC